MDIKLEDVRIVSTPVSLSESLSWKLGKLMPSDRRFLEKALGNPVDKTEVIKAVETFIVRWEEADWLEAYSIERVGRWIAKQQDAGLNRHFADWATLKPTDARKALLEGLRAMPAN